MRDNSRASRILSSLEKKGVFKRESLGPGKSYRYSINTIIANWDNCINQQLLSQMAILVVPKMTRVALYEKTIPIATNFASPKETQIKDIKQDDLYIDINSLLEHEEAKRTWEEVLVELKTQFSLSNYRTWLEGTQGLGYVDTCLIVGVPNRFTIEYLEKNQRSTIERTLMGISKYKIEFSFIDITSLKSTATQQDETLYDK